MLRQARYYRGRIQIEDEEEFGFKHLSALLGRPDWVDANFLLARETVRSLPHHGGADRTRKVRRISKDIADQDQSFERIRIKLHTRPSSSDIDLVADWVGQAIAEGKPAERIEAAKGLGRELEVLYGSLGRAERLEWALKLLAGTPEGERFTPLLRDVLAASAAERIVRFASAMRILRETITASKDGARSVGLMDLSIDIETELRTAAFEFMTRAEAPRAELLRLSFALLDAAYGAGLLMPGEHEALAQPIAGLLAGTSTTGSDYLRAVQGLKRSGGWALATVRYAFAEPLVRYTALEPKAAQFSDDLLRGSVMLPLASFTTALTRDAETLAGVAHVVFGKRAGGLAGLNPGVAVGRLRVVREEELLQGASLGSDEIVVLPRTLAELTPVAGIVTLSEGNILSHMQLLARNLGIPNAAVDPNFAELLTPHAGQRALFAVGSDGSTVLERYDSLPEALRAGLADRLGPKGEAPLAMVEAPAPDLTVMRPLALADLHTGLSGKVVGPKAANVGELARQFPGRVAPAVALPFGAFAAHVEAGEGAPKARLDRAFAEHRAGRLSEEQLAAEVEAMRVAVASLAISTWTREQLSQLMAESFGPPGSYGLFVRSDTNVEDLPQFTGAGLNMTIPNVVGLDKQLAAIPKVWSSPYAARAMAWRRRALLRPEEVYPSVLLMKSVPADKSGVLVTSDLIEGGEGLTVACAWGVGGAVDGETTESLVLRPDGSTLVVSLAKAPYRRALDPASGITWLPAPAGAVLADSERQALRDLAVEARSRLAPVPGPDGQPLPWDIEFGFVEGKLYLFQVRPLVETQRASADRIVKALVPRDGSSARLVALADSIPLQSALASRGATP